MPDDLTSKAQTELTSGVPFISDADLEAGARRRRRVGDGDRRRDRRRERRGPPRRPARVALGPRRARPRRAVPQRQASPPRRWAPKSAEPAAAPAVAGRAQSVMGGSPWNGLPALLPLLVQLHEVRAEGIAAHERHGGAADGEVHRRELAGAHEVAARGVVVAAAARLGGDPEVQAGAAPRRRRGRAPRHARRRREIVAVPSRTHARTRVEVRPAYAPVNSANMSVENATLLGRTMRSSSSIQITVGTLLIAYSSVSTCWRVDEHRQRDAFGPRADVVGGLVERDRDDGEVRRQPARPAAPATRAGRSGSLTRRRTRGAGACGPATPTAVPRAVEVGELRSRGRRASAGRRVAARSRGRRRRCRRRRRPPPGGRARRRPRRGRASCAWNSSVARSRTGTQTSSRHRPSGFSVHPSASGSRLGVERTRPSATTASTVTRVSSAITVTVGIGVERYDARSVRR